MPYSMIFSNYFQVELPEYWLEKPLQHLTSNEKFSFVDGPFGSDLKSEEYQDEGVPLIQLNNIKDGQHIFNTIKYISEKKKNILSRHVAFPNDVVIAKMAEPVARAALVSSKFTEYVIVADCVKLTPNLNKVNLQYLIWAINSDEVKRKAEQVSTGTTRIRINLGELKKLKIPFPPIQEQTKIAQFLDHETAKIDQLIEKQKTLIELLKEKRQAVISHAVTKGLDPNVKMKDSGVEWLGEVPEHWEVTKFPYEVFFQEGPGILAPDFHDDGIPLLRIQNIKTDYVSNDFKNFLDPKKVKDKWQHFSVGLGDLIISGSASTDLISEVDASTIGSIPYTGLIRLKPKSKRISKDYIKAFVQSNLFKDQIKTLQTGSTIQHFGPIHLQQIRMSAPPIDEQNIIISFLTNQTSKIDLLIQKAEQQIELMKERRTALISAAVTGTIDVRDWQPEQ